MARTHEAPAQKIPELNFTPEGYVDENGPDFLEQFLQRVQAAGFDTTQVVYSGVDGEKFYLPDGSVETPDAIFGMNETGWREAIRKREITPAGYVKKDADVPIIALYDAHQLAQPKSYKLKQNLEDYWAPVQITDIVPGDLKPLQPGDMLEEVVIHLNFPNASVAEALMGVVRVEEESYKPIRDHGL